MTVDEARLKFTERRNTGTAWTRNDKFEKDGYLVLRNVVDPENLYHPVPSERGMIHYAGSVDKFEHVENEVQVPGSLARYYHPQYKKTHTKLRKRIEEEIGRKLYNTYYYDRFYFPGQELEKHTDRDACEISITVHVSTNLPDNLKDWPIWVKTPDVYSDKSKTQILVPGEQRSAVLQPGDAMIYKGCERPHWRDPMPGGLPEFNGNSGVVTPQRKNIIKDFFSKKVVVDKPKEPTIEYYYHQIFFHYVLQDGERASKAWDRDKERE